MHAQVAVGALLAWFWFGFQGLALIALMAYAFHRFGGQSAGGAAQASSGGSGGWGKRSGGGGGNVKTISDLPKPAQGG